MNFEDLDEDTKTIIDGMCQHTGHIRETAVHNLVELGMMAMVAAYNPAKRDRLMSRITKLVNEHEPIKQTAKAYDAVWDV